MDQLVNDLKDMLKDDSVIKNVNMVRKKVTPNAKYVVGQTQVAKYLVDILEKVKFSKLIDKSIDRGFAKTMCVCVWYHISWDC